MIVNNLYCLKLMVTGIINNATDSVKIYTVCINNTETINLPFLGDINEQFSNMVIIGKDSSADAILEQCTITSRYILICIWELTTLIGEPNSWIVYDLNDQSIVKSSINNYTSSLDGNFTSGYIITIRAGQGGGRWWLYILMILFILIVIGAGIGVFYGLNKSVKRKPLHIL